MTVTSRDAARIVQTLEEKRWRVRNLGGTSWLAYPPNGGGAVAFAVARDPRARNNTYARFRRVGIELDPARMNRINPVRVSPRRLAQPVLPPLSQLIRQEPLPDNYGTLDITAVRWVNHAEQRLLERGISIFEVFAALAHPQKTWQDQYDLDRMHYTRGDIEVIYEPDALLVITVIDRLEKERLNGSIKPRKPLFDKPEPKPEPKPSTQEGTTAMVPSKAEPNYKPDVEPLPGMARTTTAAQQYCELMYAEQPGKPWNITDFQDMFLPNRHFNKDGLMQAFHTFRRNLPAACAYRVVKPEDSHWRDGFYICIPAVSAGNEPDEAPKLTEVAQQERRFTRAEEHPAVTPSQPTASRAVVPRQRAGGIAPVNGKLEMVVAKWADGEAPAATTTSNGHGYLDNVDELLRANPGRQLTLTFHEIDMGEAATVWLVPGTVAPAQDQS